MAYGLAAGTYTVNLQDSLKQQGLQVSRRWNSLDDLLNELDENRGFIYELETIIILDDALDKIFLTHQKASKIMQLQKQFADDNADVKLKLITLNKDLYAQLKDTLKRRTFGVYNHFELHFVVKKLTIQNIISFYNEDFADYTPPVANKDSRDRAIEDLRLTLRRLDTIVNKVDEFRSTVIKDLDALTEDINQDFKNVTQQLKDIEERL